MNNVYLLTKIMKLEHFIKLIVFCLPHLNEKNLYEFITGVLGTIQRIENRGFINCSDLSTYPIFKSFLQLLQKEDEIYEENHPDETFKWIYNLILIKLYEMILKNFKEEEEKDKANDLNSLAKEIYAKMHTSIKRCLQKRGISIKQNIFTGFDTEYKYLEYRKTNYCRFN